LKNNVSQFSFLPLCLALAAFGAPLAVCSAAPSDVTPAQSAPAADCQLAIQTAYNQINDSFATNHLDRGCVFIENDYRQVDPHGHAMDKVSTRNKFQSERNMIRTIQTQCSITSLTVAPDGVHVRMATHSSGTGVKRIMFFNVKGTFVNDLRVNDLWVNTPDGWRLKSRLMLQDNSRLTRS